MIVRLLPARWQPQRLDDRFRARRINREPSPILAIGLPWVSVMLLSMATFSPIIASATVVPPLSFMALIGWRILRPGLLPVWAGAPLGAFDDLYSGQPLGSAVVLWSLAMLAMEYADFRFRYRGFLQDWLVAALLFCAVIALGLVIAALAGGGGGLRLVVPQMLLSVSLYPLVTGLITLLDRVRLLPVRSVGQ